MTTETPKPDDALVERLSGPHEWGYRCLTDGTFIADDAPFDAAEALSRHRVGDDLLREAREVVDGAFDLAVGMKGRDRSAGRAANNLANLRARIDAHLKGPDHAG